MRGVVSTAAMLALVAVAVSGASARAPARGLPWVVDGPVNALAVADGKLFVGGEFKSVAAPMGPLVAFTGAGTRDAAFPAADLNAEISTVIGDGAGGFYVGGDFASLGGLACARLAHVLHGGTVDRRFCPRADGPVRTLALAGSTLYVGGEFGRIAGAARRRLAALDLRTGHVTAFKVVDTPLSIWQVAVSPSAVYVLGGEAFVAFDPASGRKLPFAPRPDATIHGDSVAGFALAGTRIYAWGYFTRIGGKPRDGIAAVDATTGKALDWQPGIGASAGLVSDGVLYLGGCFRRVGAEPRLGLAAFSAADGKLLPWHAAAVPCAVDALTVSNGVLYAAGPRSIHDDVPSVVVARSLQSGAAVRSPVPQVNGTVATLAASADGRLVVGGHFPSLAGAPHPLLFSVDAASGRLLAWQSRMSGASVEQLGASGSTVYAAGFFDRAAGKPRNEFAAFDARTGALRAWRTPLGYVEGFAAAPGGVYTATNENGNERLFQLDERTGRTLHSVIVPGGTGALAASADAVFDANWDGDAISVTAIEVHPLRVAASLNFTQQGTGSVSQVLLASGRSVYLGGAFTHLPGLAQRYLARLTLHDGALTPDAWHPLLPGPVLAVADAGRETLAAVGSTPDDSRGYVALVDRATGKVRRIWSDPGDELSGAKAIAVSGRTVYVGGAFGLLRFRA